MSLVVAQSDYFWADLQLQVDWYRDRAGSEIAAGYVNAVQATLQQLSNAPAMGRLRFLDWPALAGIRSWRVQKPYHRHLIFYRFDDNTLFAERTIHGSRDLPRRLRQSPYEGQH
jgi:plasmid stabilization system protein ParE